jgi:hypothetical protein
MHMRETVAYLNQVTQRVEEKSHVSLFLKFYTKFLFWNSSASAFTRTTVRTTTAHAQIEL